MLPSASCLRVFYHKVYPYLPVSYLSLCLTKYHAMKPYPVLDQALRNEDVLSSGDTAPRVLNLDAVWR